MKIKINGEAKDCEAYGIDYANDLISGIILDMDNSYIFLSDHVEAHRELQDEIEEYEYFDLQEAIIDPDEAPHSWILLSVSRLIVQTAEQLLD